MTFILLIDAYFIRDFSGLGQFYLDSTEVLCPFFLPDDLSLNLLFLSPDFEPFYLLLFQGNSFLSALICAPDLLLTVFEDLSKRPHDFH